MFLKVLISIFFISTASLHSNDFNFYGNIDYTKQNKSELINTIGNNFKIKIFEDKNEKYMIFFGGQIEHNYDIFLRTYHINGFTQLGIEF